MRAAIYARFSTEKQNNASIEDQFRIAERVARSSGLEVVARFADRGISGGTSARPEYQALLTAARAGVFEVIVSEDISRLWRNRAEYGQRSAELEDLGIHLVTAVGDDTRRDGWGLILGIKQAIAEHQRREISYRTRRGLEGLALAGKSTGGRVFGYAPGEAAVVQEIFARRASGFSLAQLASWLNGAGHRSPRGGAWGRSTVHAILANPRYTGAVAWGKTEVRGGAADSRRKRRVERSGGPLVERQDETLRLVSQKLFEAAQSV